LPTELPLPPDQEKKPRLTPGVDPFAAPTEVQTVNRALNQPARQSSVSTWSRSQKRQEEARGANNGDLHTPDGCHTSEEDGPWWEVDLGSEIIVERVVVYNRQECAYRLRYFSLLASTDGKQWHSFYRRNDPKTFGERADDACVVIPKIPVLAKFVRLQLNGCETLHFRECEIYGRPPTPIERSTILDAIVRTQAALGAGRTGSIAIIAGFAVFVDEDRYSLKLASEATRGVYETKKRACVENTLFHSDRILEIGTGIGVVSMAAAAWTSAAQVRTFEGDPAILSDAKRNFAYNDLSEIQAVTGVVKNRKAMSPGEKTTKFAVCDGFGRRARGCWLPVKAF
jgi:hypothetical protein